MPVIFDEEKRKRVRLTLLENGFQLIKKFGMKKTSIEEISKSSGIAKGTFYNFFESKEDFVTEIILYKRNRLKQDFSELVAKKGYLSKNDIREFLKKLVYDDANLFPYLTVEDIAILTTRVQGFTPNENQVEETTNTMLSYIQDKSSDCDWRVVANYIKIITLTQINRNQLLVETMSKNIEGIISLTIDTIYGTSEVSK